MDAFTRKVHDIVPTVFLILKARNRKRYDVAGHLMFQFKDEIGQIMQMLAKENQELIMRGGNVDDSL